MRFAFTYQSLFSLLGLTLGVAGVFALLIAEITDLSIYTSNKKNGPLAQCEKINEISISVYCSICFAVLAIASFIALPIINFTCGIHYLPIGIIMNFITVICVAVSNIVSIALSTKSRINTAKINLINNFHSKKCFQSFSKLYNCSTSESCSINASEYITNEFSIVQGKNVKFCIAYAVFIPIIIFCLLVSFVHWTCGPVAQLDRIVDSSL